MANLVYMHSTSLDMPSIALSPGQIIYCADISKTYYDTTGLKRVIMDRVVYSYTEKDRLSINVNRLDDNTLYIVTSTGTFWRWSLATDWVQLHYTSELDGILTLVERLVPSTIKQYGTMVAPKTLATQVYTKDGERVEDVLDDITRIGKTYRYIEVTDPDQRTYTIPLPFKNYFELGNYIDVYVGSVWISPKRYSIITNDELPVAVTNLIFSDDEEVLTVGREIAVIYTYNTARMKDMVYAGVNGNYIIDGTIPIRKLEKYSDSYLVDDRTSVATSRSVFELYNDINTKLNFIAGNLIAHAISYNTGFDLKADIENFELVDNSTIYLKLHTDIMDGATLTVNGGIPIPIYLNYKEPVKSGLKEGDVISLTYSKMAGKFFVNSSVAYRLMHYSQIYTCTGGDTTIPITIEDFLPGYDTLHVSHNNLKLYEDVNFTINGHNLILKYSCEKDDIIEITLDKVVGNGLPVDGNTIMKELTFTNDVIFKADARFEGNINFNNGSIDKDGNITTKGNITSTDGNVTGKQLISTIDDGEPPLIVKSTTMVPNLNADMVDDYHAVDLAIPDTSVEFIIDGESEIMDPDIQIALRSFMGRIEALKDRMVMSDANNVYEPVKLSYEDLTKGDTEYIWPEDEPLGNENVRDTVEEVVFEMDKLNFKILATETIEDLNINIDDLNEMTGDEFVRGAYTKPDQYSLMMTWEDMKNYIDAALFEIEEKMLICVDKDTSEGEILDSHEAVAQAYATIDIDKYDIPEISRRTRSKDTEVDTGGKTQATALRAMYLKTDNKRFYPITHKNAIVGMPFGDIATAKSVSKLTKEKEALAARVEYLENVVQQLLSGGTGGSGRLVMLEGLATKLS